MNYEEVFKPKIRGKGYNPFNKITEGYKEVNRLVYGNVDYPSKVKKILSKVGDAKVKTAVVIRNPISSVITEFLRHNTDKLDYDKLFHLAIVFDTDKGQVLIEKNEVLNIAQTVQMKEGAETYPIEINEPITINQILDNTRKYQTDSKFFKYSAYDNNCQDFILALLKSNNLGNEDVYRFVKQDTEEIFRSNPYLRKLANTITDIAGRFTGAGQKRGGLIVKANPFGDW